MALRQRSGRRALLGVAACAALATAACDSETAPTVTTGDDGDARATIVAGAAGLEAYLDCLSDERVTLVSAHRGGPGPGYPENALATLAHTFAEAPVMLEVDVHQTADGELVLIHDESLDDASTCHGRVADATWAAVRDCRLRDTSGRATDHRPMRFADALAWSEGRTVLQVDIKPSADYERVIAEVRRAVAEDRVILITYSAGAAARLARLAPDLVISAPVDSLDELRTLRNRDVDLDELAAWTGTQGPNPSLYEALDDRDVPVIFGTLGPWGSSIDGAIARSGDDARYVELSEDGVDILATDRPIEAYAALAAERDPSLALEACRNAR